MWFPQYPGVAFIVPYPSPFHSSLQFPIVIVQFHSMTWFKIWTVYFGSRITPCFYWQYEDGMIKVLFILRTDLSNEVETLWSLNSGHCISSIPLVLHTVFHFQPRTELLWPGPRVMFFRFIVASKPAAVLGVLPWLRQTGSEGVSEWLEYLSSLVFLLDLPLHCSVITPSEIALQFHWFLFLRSLEGTFGNSGFARGWGESWRWKSCCWQSVW